jgi:hypothetical protein
MKHVHIFNHHYYHQTLHEQVGKGIPVFTGYRQKGGGLGSILGFIGKYAIPLINKYVLPHAKTALVNTVSDLGSGKTLKQSLKSNSVKLLQNVGNEIVKRQIGNGLGSKKIKLSPKIKSVHCKKPELSHLPFKKSKTKKQAPKPKPKRKPKSKRDIFG